MCPQSRRNERQERGGERTPRTRRGRNVPHPLMSSLFVVCSDTPATQGQGAEGKKDKGQKESGSCISTSDLDATERESDTNVCMYVCVCVGVCVRACV